MNLKNYIDTGLILSLIAGVVYVVTGLNTASFNNETTVKAIERIEKAIGRIDSKLENHTEALLEFGENTGQLNPDLIKKIVVNPPKDLASSQVVNQKREGSAQIGNLTLYPQGAIQPDEDVSGYSGLLDPTKQPDTMNPSKFVVDNPELVKIKSDLAGLQLELSAINDKVDELIREGLKSEQ